MVTSDKIKENKSEPTLDNNIKINEKDDNINLNEEKDVKEDIIVVDSLPVDTLWSLSDDFAR